MNPTAGENAAEMSPISITLETKMEVIRRIEDGQTRPYVCRRMILAQSTVSAIMTIAYGIKQAEQHAATAHATQVNYFRSKLLQKREKLLSCGWMT